MHPGYVVGGGSRTAWRAPRSRPAGRRMSGAVFDVGASLAAARETRGLSLADAERLTCIRAKYLAALERGDFAALPGRTYGRAFLRTYAHALGLDADRCVDAFEEDVPEPPESALALPPPRRRPWPKVAAAALAAAVVAGVVGWAASTRTTHTLPPAAASSTPTTTTTAAGVLGAHHTHRAVGRPHPARPAALVVSATRGDCWLLVRRGGPAGAVLYEGTLRQGSTIRFATPQVWVRFGAPGMVDVHRGAKRVPGLAGMTPVDVTA